VKINGIYCLATIEKVETSADFGRIKQPSITLTFYTGNYDKVKEAITQISSYSRKTVINPTYAQTSDIVSFDSTSRRINMRGLSSIFIPAVQKAEIVEDITQFMRSKDLYVKRGTPRRRAYLLHGPSGTGKTSLPLALAAHFKNDITVLRGASLNKGQVIAQMQRIAEYSFVLIEDIDVDLNVMDRQQESFDPDSMATTMKPTMAEIFNGFDGAETPENLIFFITTNHLIKLDPAMARPGRIDRQFLIGSMAQPEQIEMSKLYYDEPVQGVNAYIKPAKVQQIYQICQTAQEAQAALEAEVAKHPNISIEQEYRC
jgi:chaperone BCS1